MQLHSNCTLQYSFILPDKFCSGLSFSRLLTNQTASFCSLKEALEVDWTTEKAKAGLKRTPVDYFLLHGMTTPTHGKHGCSSGAHCQLICK